MNTFPVVYDCGSRHTGGGKQQIIDPDRQGDLCKHICAQAERINELKAKLAMAVDALTVPPEAAISHPARLLLAHYRRQADAAVAILSDMPAPIARVEVDFCPQCKTVNSKIEMTNKDGVWYCKCGSPIIVGASAVIVPKEADDGQDG